VAEVLNLREGPARLHPINFEDVLEDVSIGLWYKFSGTAAFDLVAVESFLTIS